MREPAELEQAIVEARLGRVTGTRLARPAVEIDEDGYSILPETGLLAGPRGDGGPRAAADDGRRRDRPGRTRRACALVPEAAAAGGGRGGAPGPAPPPAARPPRAHPAPPVHPARAQRHVLGAVGGAGDQPVRRPREPDRPGRLRLRGDRLPARRRDDVPRGHHPEPALLAARRRVRGPLGPEAGHGGVGHPAGGVRAADPGGGAGQRVAGLPAGVRRDDGVDLLPPGALGRAAADRGRRRAAGRELRDVGRRDARRRRRTTRWPGCSWCSSRRRCRSRSGSTPRRTSRPPR